MRAGAILVASFVVLSACSSSEADEGIPHAELHSHRDSVSVGAGGVSADVLVVEYGERLAVEFDDGQYADDAAISFVRQERGEPVGERGELLTLGVEPIEFNAVVTAKDPVRLDVVATLDRGEARYSYLVQVLEPAGRTRGGGE